MARTTGVYDDEQGGSLMDGPSNARQPIVGHVAPFRRDTENVQRAPYPAELADIVENFRYRPGWSTWLGFRVRDWDHDEAGRETEPLTEGLTLVITTLTYNSRHIENGIYYQVQHIFEVPAATYDRQSWMAWLFDRCQDVDRHEAAEFFNVDGDFPFAPNHGPGRDPYRVFHQATAEQARTSYGGVVK